MLWSIHDKNNYKHLYKNKRKKKKISNKQRGRREKKGSEDESQKGTNTFLQVRKRIQEEEFFC